METQTKINIIGAVVLILSLIAGYTLVGNTDLEPTHYCEEREIKAFCYSLSSTMKTCYTEINRTGGKRCDVWKEIGNVEEIIPEVPTGVKWQCPPFQSECILID